MPKVDKKAAVAQEEAIEGASTTTMITAAARSATKRAASGSYTQKTLTSMFSKSKTTTAKAGTSGKGEAKEVAAVTETVAQVDNS